MDVTKLFGAIRRNPPDRGSRMGGPVGGARYEPELAAGSASLRRNRRPYGGGAAAGLGPGPSGATGSLPKRIIPGVVNRTRMEEAGGGGTTPVGGIIDVGRVVGGFGGGATVLQQNTITGVFRRRQITLPAPRISAPPRRPSEAKWIMMPVQNFIQGSESSEDTSVNQDTSLDEEDDPAGGRSKGGQTETRSSSSSSSYESLTNYPHVQERGHSQVRVLASQRLLHAGERKETQCRQNPYASGPDNKSQENERAPQRRPSITSSPSDTSSREEVISMTNSSKISSLSTSGSECRTGSATSERVAWAVERIMGGQGPKAIKLTSTVIKILPETSLRRPEPAITTTETNLDEDAETPSPPPPLPESRPLAVQPKTSPLDERGQLQARLHSLFQSRGVPPIKTAVRAPKRPPRHPPAHPSQVVSHLTARLKEATGIQSRIRIKSSPYMLQKNLQTSKAKDSEAWDTRRNQMKVLARNHSLLNVPKKSKTPQGHKDLGSKLENQANPDIERTSVKGPTTKPPVPVSLNRKQDTPQQPLPSKGATQPAPQRPPLNEILGAGGKIVQMRQHKVPKTMEDGVDMSYQYFVSIPLKRGRKAQVVRYLYRPMVRNLNGTPAPTRRSLRRAKRKAAEAAAAAAAALEAEQDDLEAAVESMETDPDLVALGGVPVLLAEPAPEEEKLRRSRIILDPEAELNAPYEEPPLMLEAKYMPMLAKLAQMPYPEERHGRRRRKRRARVAGGSEQVAPSTCPFSDGECPQPGLLGGIFGGGEAAREGARLAAGISTTESRRALDSLWSRSQVQPEMRSSLINYRPHATRLNTATGIPISYHTPVFLGQPRSDGGAGSPTGNLILSRFPDEDPTEPMIRAVTYEDVQQEVLAESSDPNHQSASSVRKAVSFRPDSAVGATTSAGCAASGMPSSGTSIHLSSLSAGDLGARTKVKGRISSRKSKAKVKGKSKPRSKNRR
ncbi:uncharacterized protein [Drosophila bipectinata]|uniref:uncharacterized protein n=1 Tax=Drosophila bipectinata TaxID=42026 RepID=UPI0038B3CEE1